MCSGTRTTITGPRVETSPTATGIVCGFQTTGAMKSGKSLAISNHVSAVLLLALVFLVFLPALKNGFVNFDDNVYIYDNPHVQAGLSWKSIGWAFSNLDAGFWQPLTWISLLIDRQVFGPGPAGFHFTSILLHALTTVVLFHFLNRVT